MPVTIPKRVLNHGLHVPRWERLSNIASASNAGKDIYNAIAEKRFNNPETKLHASDSMINTQNAADSEYAKTREEYFSFKSKRMASAWIPISAETHWETTYGGSFTPVSNFSRSNRIIPGGESNLIVPDRKRSDKTGESTNEYFEKHMKIEFERQLIEHPNLMPKVSGDFSALRGIVPGYQGWCKVNESRKKY